jgi:hypothetical protein
VGRSADGWTGSFVRDDRRGMPSTEVDVLETGEETPLDFGRGPGLRMVRMIVTRTVGDSHVTDFDTPGCRKSSRGYSQQYQAGGAVSGGATERRRGCGCQSNGLLRGPVETTG